QAGVDALRLGHRRVRALAGISHRLARGGDRCLERADADAHALDALGLGVDAALDALDTLVYALRLLADPFVHLDDPLADLRLLLAELRAHPVLRRATRDDEECRRQQDAVTSHVLHPLLLSAIEGNVEPASPARRKNHAPPPAARAARKRMLDAANSEYGAGIGPVA